MSLLEQFDYLRNNDPTNRLAATLRIFTILDIPSKPVSVVTSLDELKDEYGTDVQYTMTRLVKGLASNRESARLGFSAALSELLRALPKIDLSFVIQAIEKATTPGGNVKGQETRDYQFGRLFGLQAICTSGLLSRSSMAMEDVLPVLGLLFELAMSKGWLRESCASVMIQILDQLSSSKSVLTCECANTIHEMLYTAQLSRTMEGIAIALKCTENGSSVAHDDWHHGRILHNDNLAALNKIMRDLGAGDEQTSNEKQTGTWKPRLHFCWLLIIRAILADENEDSIKFGDFWRIVVDEGLFSTNASHERKFWGFQLFNVLVVDLDVAQLPTLFSPNFLRTLSNQIAQTERYLNKAAKASSSAMITAVSNDARKSLPILTALWNYNFFFDRLSKEKTCETLMLRTPPDQLPELVSLLIQKSNPPRSQTDDTVKETEKRRQFVADNLLGLLRSGTTQKQEEWVLPILDFFARNGLFKTTKPKKWPFQFHPELTESTQAIFRSRLQSALGYLMPTTTLEVTAPIYTAEIVRHISSFRSTKYFDLILQPDDTIMTLLETAERRLERLEKKRCRASTSKQALAFILLYSLTILQVYAGESDAVQVLEDLDDCYRQVFDKSPDTNSSQGPEVDTIDLLVELLLGFLSRESTLFRKLVESVFTVFAPQMTKSSLQLLLNVLTANESGEELFDKAEGGSEAEEDEDEEMDDDDKSESSVDENEPEDEQESDVEMDGGRDEALTAALSEALGTKKRLYSTTRPAGEGHSSDFEASSDEEEEDLMTDEQMLAMDATLEKIFANKKQSTKKSERADMVHQTTTFKRKVFDLLEIYLKQNPESPQILDFIEPILFVARKSSARDLRDHAILFLRQKLIKSRPTLDHSSDDPTRPASQPSSHLDRIRRLHQQAQKSPTPPFLTACSQLSLFLCRLLLSTATGEQELSGVLDIYAASQKQWITQKSSKMTPSFFVDFINWSTSWRLNRFNNRHQGRKERAGVTGGRAEEGERTSAGQEERSVKGQNKRKRQKT